MSQASRLPEKPAASPPVFLCGRFSLALDRPLVMGIVNVTPDSFSDGGRFFNPAAAIEHAARLVAAGADLLDIGGESTRPQAVPISETEELERVLPVLRAALSLAVPISIDTRRPKVMQAAIDLGVDIINDVSGFQAPDTFRLAAQSPCGLCIMHMQGSPQTMQQSPHYRDVVAEVSGFLIGQRDAFVAEGVDARRMLLDPGFGFGKTLDHNLSLMRAIADLSRIHPLLVGVSRKQMIGAMTGVSAPSDRVLGSVMAAVWAAAQGAQVLRVHDVAETVAALAVWRALESGHD
jgi:dihydropteroate synthase